MGGEDGLVGRDFNSVDNRYHYFKTKELILLWDALSNFCN